MKRKLGLLLALPLIPLAAFLTNSTVRDRWHEWRREWQRQ